MPQPCQVLLLLQTIAKVYTNIRSRVSPFFTATEGGGDYDMSGNMSSKALLVAQGESSQ